MIEEVAMYMSWKVPVPVLSFDIQLANIYSV